MSSSTQDLAALARDAYVTRSAAELSEVHDIGGVQYRILEQVDRPSGYQGTVYQRMDNGEIVVAHRGTEFGREFVKDGLLADAGMVLTGINAQARDALDVTRRTVELANATNAGSCTVPAITVTGHSLGGTLAQITAHRLGLRAETFNAYGAAGLVADDSPVDPNIVNHVRASDFVSAASKQIGDVRVYALQDDIDALSRHGYDNARHGIDVRNPFGVVFGIGGPAHFSDNFTDANARGQSIINDVDAGRAQANAEMIDDYRGDVRRAHAVLAAPRNAVDAVLDLGARITGHARRDEVPSPAFDAGRCAWDARVPDHPEHALFLQSRDGVHGIDAGLGRTPDATSDRLIASVFRGAREAGLDRIDAVVASAPTADAPAGRYVFAVQGGFDDPLRKLARVDTVEALRTPVEAAFEAAANVASNVPAVEAARPMRPMTMSVAH